MKALAAAINTLLALFIILSGTTFVIARTTSANYLEKTVQESNVYQGISEVVSKQLLQTSARNLGVPEDMLSKNISNVVSKEYVQLKSSEISTQIEQVLRGESEKLTIDFSDLAAQAQAAGLQVNSTDLKPLEVTLPNNTSDTVVRTAQSLDLLQFISYTLTAVLLIVSIVLAAIRRSTLGLGLAFILSAFNFAIFALASHLMGPVLAKLIALPETVSELNTYADAFAKTIISDISSQYFIFAAVLLVASLLCFVVHRLLKPLRASATAHTQQPPISQQ